MPNPLKYKLLNVKMLEWLKAWSYSNRANLDFLPPGIPSEEIIKELSKYLPDEDKVITVYRTHPSGFSHYSMESWSISEDFVRSLNKSYNNSKAQLHSRLHSVLEKKVSSSDILLFYPKLPKEFQKPFLSNEKEVIVISGYEKKVVMEVRKKINYAKSTKV